MNAPFINIASFDQVKLRGCQEIEQALMQYINASVVREIAYIAQTTPQGGDEPFLVTNAATIFPTADATQDELQSTAQAVGYFIKSNQRIGRIVYKLVPMNAMENPSVTVSVARGMAELDLIQEDKTRSNLVETRHDKRR
ncbi:MAG: hypothetical protein IH991_12210 [Planctomycetes bacterium]|nr:hypothetical protein [Planctomycetota bacterium]